MRFIDFIIKETQRCNYLRKSYYLIMVLLLFLISIITLKIFTPLSTRLPEEIVVCLSPFIPYSICLFLFNTFLPTKSRSIAFWLTVPYGFHYIFRRSFLYSFIIYSLFSLLLALLWGFSSYICISTLIIYNIWLFSCLVLIVYLQPIDPYSKLFYKLNFRIAGYNLLNSFPAISYMYSVYFLIMLKKETLEVYLNRYESAIIVLLFLFSILNTYLILLLSRKYVLNNKSRIFVRMKL